MAIVIAIGAIVICYIATFKNDFNQEDLGKAFPFIVAIVAIAILASLLSNL